MAPLQRLVMLAAICLAWSVCASPADESLNTCSANASSSSGYASHDVHSDLPTPAALEWGELLPSKRSSGFQLTIGVKSRVINGFESRQAIRETWASDLPPDIRVVFLGCQPDFSGFSTSEIERIEHQLRLERLQYDDLLINELLSCQDSYDDLVNKVLAFFQWTTRSPAVDATATKAFVMVADDDVYIRLDGLRQLLMLESITSTRFYGGQVWAVQHRRPIEPQRSPLNTKYYLPHNQYAMNHLPPFANGPHYILSADVARFLGEHRAMFRGVGGERSSSSSSVGTLDDVSVALWTLAMQIHPVHFPQFANLRDGICRNNLITYADITTAAFRQIHDSLQSKNSFCNGFSYMTWLKRTRPRGGNDQEHYLGRLEPDVQRQLDTLYVLTRVHRPSEKDPVDVFLFLSLRSDTTATPTTLRFHYAPFVNSFFPFCDELARKVQATFSILVDHNEIFCQWLNRKLVQDMDRVLSQQPAQRTIYKLVRHNIGSDEASPRLTVAIASSARYAMVVVECLFSQMYPGAELVIADEEDVKVANQNRAPDIVVFAPSSATNRPGNQHEIVRSYVEAYGLTSRMVMLGHLDRADERVVMLSPRSPMHYVEDSGVNQQLYLPAAATAFAASKQHSPVELLEPSKVDEKTVSERPPRQFCVDQYEQRECDLPHRQYFYTLLNNLDHVDAIGDCPGNLAKPTTGTLNPTTNETIFYLDEKISLFSGYKFVIAFEESASIPGFVSDTIVAAFLAGAVPIYYGHSATAIGLFNSRAFIDCGSFHSLRACARHVLAVHASASLYAALRREAPIVNTTAFVDAFSWHPDVVDSVTRDRAGGASRWTSSALLGEQLKEVLDNHAT